MQRNAQFVWNGVDVVWCIFIQNWLIRSLSANKINELTPTILPHCRQTRFRQCNIIALNIRARSLSQNVMVIMFLVRSASENVLKP